MKSLSPIIAGLMVGVAIFGGCSRYENKALAYDELKASDVVLELNGRKLTKGDFELERNLRLSLLKAALPASQYKAMEKTATESILKGLLDCMIQDYLLLSVADDYFKTNHPAAFDEGIARARKIISETFSVKGTNGVSKTMEQMSAALPSDELRRRFVAKIEENTRVEACLNFMFPGKLQFTDAQITNALAKVAIYNARVQATNAWQFVTASNVWKRAVSGEDFATLADRFSQDSDKEPGGMMGECNKHDFADEPEAWELIEHAKEGTVLPPLLTGKGLEIYRVNSKNPGEKSEDGRYLDMSVDLSRIFFRVGVECKDYTIEEYRAEMEPHNRTVCMQKVLSEAWRSATLTFPHGSGILPSSVWSKLPGFPGKKAPIKTKK